MRRLANELRPAESHVTETTIKTQACRKNPAHSDDGLKHRIGLSVDFLQPVCELPGFGPSCFNEQIENLEQCSKTIRFLDLCALKNVAVVCKRPLNEFHHISNRKRFILVRHKMILRASVDEFVAKTVNNG
ncbi:MAG: hypothetical protein ABMA26_19455 [Limisphaerales bacterium]